MNDENKTVDAEVVEPGTEIKEAGANSPAPVNHDSLIELAITKGADPGTMERLFALKERHDNNEAKKAYVVAMAQFKTLCPAIYKTKDAHNCKYAPLSDILEQIKTAMNTCGLSQAWKTNQENKVISVTCVVTHVLGHSEETTLQAEPDSSGSKNSIQAVGSSVSYLQRYTLKSLLGLAEGDDDGNSAAPQEAKKVTEQQGLKLEGLLDEHQVTKADFLKHGNIESIYDLPAATLNGAIKWIKDNGKNDE